jgi:hypothetical protein
MKENTPLETSITRRILTYLKTIPRCKAEKRHGGAFGNGGKPDITGCLDGLRFEFEVKRKGNVASFLQKKELAEWEDAGAVTAVVYSVQEVMTIIQMLQLSRKIAAGGTRGTS